MSFSRHTRESVQSPLVVQMCIRDRSDYVAVIDSLKEVQPDALDVHEKYILAVSYIKGQAVDNFSSEAKDNILSRLNVKGCLLYTSLFRHTAIN